MADSTETKALLLQISASTELLKQNLAEANKHVAAFEQGTDEKLSLIDRAFEKTGEKVKEHVGEIAAGFVAFVAVEHLIDLGKEGLEYAASLKEVAEQLGTTTTFLQQFRYAAGQVGIGQEEADKALGKFTQNLSKAKAGVKEAAGVFAQLGVSGADLKKLDQHDILLKTADGLAKLKDGVTRAAPEVALFGKTGQLLEPLLAQGSAGINRLAQAASDLGIVLSPEQIEKAGQAAHKFEELKTVLEANIAGFVADNADAIYGLASSLEKLALEAIDFVKDVKLNVGALVDVFDPFLASGETAFEKLGIKVTSFHDQMISILQGLDEFRNIPLDVVNGLDGRFKSQTGFALPNAITGTAGVARSDTAGEWERGLKDRQTEAALDAMDERLKPAEKAEGGTFTDPAAAAEAKRAADEAARKAAEAKRKAAALATEITERAKKVATDEAHLDDAYLAAQGSLTADTVTRAQIERERLQADTKAKLADIDTQAKLDGEKAARGAASPEQAAAIRKTFEEQAKELKVRVQRNADLQSDEINQKESEALEQQRLGLASAQLDDLRDQLGSQSSLATTSKQRLAIALRLLAAEKEAERGQLQSVADDAARPESERHHSAGDIAIAQERLGTLDARYAGREATARQENASPLDAYKRQLQTSVGDTNEALQTIEVGGLGDLESAFAGIVTGSKSVSASIKEMVDACMMDAARLEVA